MNKTDIKDFLKEYGTPVSETRDADTELYMDDHTCIKWGGIEYYVRESSMMYTEMDRQIVDYLDENFHV